MRGNDLNHIARIMERPMAAPHVKRTDSDSIFVTPFARNVVSVVSKPNIPTAERIVVIDK